MTRFFFAFALLLCTTACRKSTEDANPSREYTKTDVAYGGDPLEKMDLSFISNRNDSTPFVVLIHGGAWMAGDKDDLTQAIGSFTSQGINVANINYRLTDNTSSSVRAADLLADVGMAIKMLHDRAGEWHIRSTGYASFGFSAGAHLSLLYGYSYDKDGLVSAVLGLGTPSKFNDPNWGMEPYLSVVQTALPALTGEPFDSQDSTNLLLKELSPDYQPHFKPTFLMHGENDQTVPISQSESMFELLNENGIATRFVPLAGGGHSGEGASDADLELAYGQAIAWIRSYSH